MWTWLFLLEKLLTTVFAEKGVKQCCSRLSLGISASWYGWKIFSWSLFNSASLYLFYFYHSFSRKICLCPDNSRVIFSQVICMKFLERNLSLTMPSVFRNQAPPTLWKNVELVDSDQNVCLTRVVSTLYVQDLTHS